MGTTQEKAKEAELSEPNRNTSKMTTPTLYPPTTPGSYKFLKISHCVIFGLGAIYISFSLLVCIAGLSAEKDGMPAAVLPPMFVWFMIALAVLGLQACAAWKMLTNNPRFRTWNNVYGIASLTSKAACLVLWLIMMSLVASSVKSQLAQDNPLGYALAANAVDAEVSHKVTQMTMVFIVFLFITSIYPVMTLIVNNLRPMADYAQQLKSTAAYPVSTAKPVFSRTSGSPAGAVAPQLNLGERANS